MEGGGRDFLFVDLTLVLGSGEGEEGSGREGR